MKKFNKRPFHIYIIQNMGKIVKFFIKFKLSS